jgi:rhodanese-related sulfurtransferase
VVFDDPAHELTPRDAEAAIKQRGAQVIDGRRSGLAALAFRSAAWDAYNLEGRLLAWVETGEPIDPPDGHVAEH